MTKRHRWHATLAASLFLATPALAEIVPPLPRASSGVPQAIHPPGAQAARTHAPIADAHPDAAGTDMRRGVRGTSGIEKPATGTIADQRTHAHSASQQSAEYVTIARALEHGGRSAEHDPDLERALADRAQLIRQVAANRLSSRAVPAPFVPFDAAPTRAMAGPDI